ncbi:MAG: IclR family transcriptional regulator [Deltaproteobacteria bacterium]|nr:IclR family transcriptional regulator [Deltaproteobacteria bacterium]
MKLLSLEKSLLVIDVLSKHPRGLSLSQLTALLGFPAGTIHHILATFCSYGYIDQDPETKKYYLGFKFLTISSGILMGFDVRSKAYNHLRELHQKWNETVNLWIYRDGKVTILDKISKVGGLSLDTYIGFSTDPHAAAAGKVLLSELGEKNVQLIYKDRPLKLHGKNTITRLAHLMDELDNVKKQGYAIDNEEHYVGVRCVAAPIRFRGKIIAAVSLTGSIFSMTMELINEQLIELVKDTAERISSEIS